MLPSDPITRRHLTTRPLFTSSRGAAKRQSLSSRLRNSLSGVVPLTVLATFGLSYEVQGKMTMDLACYREALRLRGGGAIIQVAPWGRTPCEETHD